MTGRAPRANQVLRHQFESTARLCAGVSAPARVVAANESYHMNADKNLDRSLIIDILADRRRLNVAGRIVISTTGGPLRTIITGTKSKPTGIYNSVKTGHAQPYESQAELRFMKICEADWHVIDWLAQPHRIEVFHDEKLLTYFPDFILERTNGDIEVVEIKRNKVEEVRKDLEIKLGLAKEFYRAISFKFLILDLGDLSRATFLER